MHKVFISYSRKDKVIVRRLYETIRSITGWTDDQIWSDWNDIEIGTDWWDEIDKGIADSAKFVFMMSPNSLTSEICNKELTAALTYGKTIIPVVIDAVVDTDVHGELSGTDFEKLARENFATLQSINWHLGLQNFPSYDEIEDDNAEWHEAVSNLCEAIERNLDLEEQSTRLLNRAREWEHNAFQSGFLLSGAGVRQAEAWMREIRAVMTQESGNDQLKISPLISEFIQASSAAIRRRWRFVSGGVVLVTITFMLLLLLALINWQTAQRRESLALTNEASLRTGIDPLAALSISQRAINQRTIDFEASVINTVQSGYPLWTAPDTAELVLSNAIKSSRQIGQQTVNLASSDLRLDSARSLVFSDEFIAYAAATGDEITVSITDYTLTETLDTIVMQGDIVSLQSVAGDQLLALTSTEAVLWRQNGSVQRLTIDGDNVISCGAWNNILSVAALCINEDVRLWYPMSGQQLDSVTVANDFFSTSQGEVAWSSDSAHLAIWTLSRTEPKLAIWDIGAAEIVAEYTLPNTINDVAWVNDNQQILVAMSGRDENLVIVDTNDNIDILDGHTDRVFGITTINEDASQVMTYSADSTAIVWSIDDSVTLQVLDPRFVGDTPPALRGVVASDNASQIITYWDNGLAYVWLIDPETLETQYVVSLRGHNDAILDATLIGELLITASADETIKLWHTQSGNLIDSLAGHTNQIELLGVSADKNYLISYGVDNKIRQWMLLDENGLLQYEHLEDVLLANDSRVRQIVWEDDDLKISQGLDTVALWDVASDNLSTILTFEPENVRRFEITGDIQVLVNRGESIIRRNLETGEAFEVEIAVDRVFVLDDATIIVVEDNALFALPHNSDMLQLIDVGNVLQSAAQCDDTLIILTEADLTLWSITDLNLRQTVSANTIERERVQISCSLANQFAIAHQRTDDVTVALHNLRTGQQVDVVHVMGVIGDDDLQFSADGRLLAAIADRSLLMWRTNGLEVFPLLEERAAGDEADYDGLQWSLANNRLLTWQGTSETLLRLWDVETYPRAVPVWEQTLPVVLPAHNGEGTLEFGDIELVALQPDGTSVAIVDTNGNISLWELLTTTSDVIADTIICCVNDN